MKLSSEILLTVQALEKKRVSKFSGGRKKPNLLCAVFYFSMSFLSESTIPFEIMAVGLQKVSSIIPIIQRILY
jgi:hypothetical protein